MKASAGMTFRGSLRQHPTSVTNAPKCATPLLRAEKRWSRGNGYLRFAAEKHLYAVIGTSMSRISAPWVLAVSCSASMSQMPRPSRACSN
jgi:hypothetical protein